MPGHAKTLTPRQVAFVQYLIGPGGTQAMEYADAARKAGYKDSPHLPITAAHLAKQPLVKAEIERQQALARATLTLTSEHWNRELAYQYHRVRDKVDKDGVADASDALRSLEAWARSIGLFDTKADTANAELAARVLTLLAQAGPPALEGQYRALPEPSS